MRRRLYFMLPNVPGARASLDELLLARIEERNMHFWAKDGTPLPKRPEANFLQKTDLVHGVESGMLVAAVFGVLFGAWTSGMATAAIPIPAWRHFRTGSSAVRCC